MWPHHKQKNVRISNKENIFVIAQNFVDEPSKLYSKVKEVVQALKYNPIYRLKKAVAYWNIYEEQNQW